MNEGDTAQYVNAVTEHLLPLITQAADEIRFRGSVFCVLGVLLLAATWCMVRGWKPSIDDDSPGRFLMTCICGVFGGICIIGGLIDYLSPLAQALP